MTTRTDATAFLVKLLTAGGDARIRVPPGGNVNIYGASPYPRTTLAYAASTANDISQPAFDHLSRLVQQWPQGTLPSPAHYAGHLDQLRARIRIAYGLGAETDIVFAPSGTDLEYIALHLTGAMHGKPVTNILVGPEEVGSGCGLAAGGRFFAHETACLPLVEKGVPLAGLDDSEVRLVPLRDGFAVPHASARIASAISELAHRAQGAGRQPLAHLIHGSKTGLVRPTLDDMDRLVAHHGTGLSWVVDACQARLGGAAIRAYLARGAMVMLTGSKFMGGPPFSGFALVPHGFAAGQRPLAPGLSSVFRRAEWPNTWRGAANLETGANPGLALRLEAAIFELERYRSLEPAAIHRVTAHFQMAAANLADHLHIDMLAGDSVADPRETATLATLDLRQLPGAPDLAMAQRWHRVLAARGIRLGQPVKCVPLGSSGWGGTLRLSLSMPMIVRLASFGDAELADHFSADMRQIAQVLKAAARPAAA